MKDLRHPPPSTRIKNTENESKANTPSEQNVDAETIKNNPKVNAQLISDFYRLVETSQGVIQSGKGANYRLSHPLASKVVSTDLDPDPDPNQIEKSPSKLKQT